MIRKASFTLLMLICFALSASCSSGQTGLTPEPSMPNPASVYCEQQGNKLEIVTAADGSQNGVCIFPDGSTCDEWAYFRGECGPAKQSSPPSAPTEDPTALPIDAADYQGWWTYTHPFYSFSIMLPEDWIVEEVTTSDPLMNGHMLSLHPKYDVEKESIRMTFRRVGEETMLWPTGVGRGEFIAQGTLDITGQPAQRVLLVCPTGEVTSIWYHQGEGMPNITRGDLEFGFIYSATPFHCEASYSLSGKVQRVGEMIIASLGVGGTRQAGGDASLEGTQWVLATLNGQPPIEGTMPTAAFADSQISGSAGCNQYSGSYVASRSNLTIQEVAVTEMYCMDPAGAMEQEQSFLSALESAAGYRVTDGRLEILDPAGNTVLTFAPPAPSPEVALENTTWSLTTFVEGETATSLVNGTAISLRLAGGEVGGSAGCNDYGGSYAMEQSTLRITNVVITEKGCLDPAGIMEQEAKYTDILHNVVTFALDANQLTLSTTDGRGLVFAVQP